VPYLYHLHLLIVDGVAGVTIKNGVVAMVGDTNNLMAMVGDTHNLMVMHSPFMSRHQCTILASNHLVSICFCRLTFGR
jgi:hypothetical protein